MKKIKDNINKEERLALKQLMSRRDVILKPANKGGATVVLDVEKYHDEAMRQLNDPNYYQKLNENPTKRYVIEKIVTETVLDLIDQGEIDDDMAPLLIPANSRTSKFYLLPKIHKEGCPGRPVVSSVNCLTKKVSAYVDEIIKPIAQMQPSYVEDIPDFLRKLNKIREENQEDLKKAKEVYLVSLDMDALYTNIENNEGLETLQEKVEQNRHARPLG